MCICIAPLYFYSEAYTVFSLMCHRRMPRHYVNGAIEVYYFITIITSRPHLLTPNSQQKVQLSIQRQNTNQYDEDNIPVAVAFGRLVSVRREDCHWTRRSFRFREFRQIQSQDSANDTAALLYTDTGHQPSLKTFVQDCRHVILTIDDFEVYTYVTLSQLITSITSKGGSTGVTVPPSR